MIALLNQSSEIIESAKSFFIVKAGTVEPGNVASFQDAQPRITMILKNRRFQELKAEFLQKELEQSTIGSLDDFVTQTMRSVPRPGTTHPSQVAGNPSDR